MALSIPEIKPDADYISAGLAYAAVGWFVLPLYPDTAPENLRKRPRLGKGWPSMTSNDPAQIVDWFAGTDSMLGLHVGRSGAVVFDVDLPGAVPPALATILTDAVPFQSTRQDVPGRGHWVFTAPEGRILGNSRGSLGVEWGEVRGANGIIVAAPTAHSKPGGRYLWERTGDVPVLPESVAALLPEFSGSNGAASNEAVKAFLEKYTQSTKPRALRAVLNKFNSEAQVGSRHEALTYALAWAMREAAMDLYPAREAMNAIYTDWVALMRAEPGRFPKSEFASAMAWAVAVTEASMDKLVQRKAEVTKRLEDTAFMPDDAISREAAVGTEAPDDVATESPTKNLPSDYFGRDGLDVAKVAADVLAAGELAWGRDESFWTYTNGVWSRDAAVVEARVVNLLKGRFRGSHANNVSTVVKHRIGRLTCDPVEGYINFTDGMLDWRTGELVPHAPHFGSTVQLPVAWEPDATCPKFSGFLSEILSEDYAQLAWEMIGYLMMSGNPLQKAFLLLGKGGNGKGTVIRVIEELLGRNNISTQSLDSLSKNRFAPVTLFGKIANLAGDIDATYQESTAAFKMLTGEDPFPAEWKFGANFTFTNWAVPVFSANRVPGSADTSRGYLRRWLVIEFKKEIEDAQVIPGYSSLLATELPGIAAKGVAALREMMTRNHSRGGFYSSEEISGGAERFAESIDQVRQWLQVGVLIGPHGTEAQTDVYTTYKNWAEMNGYGKLRSAEFFERLDAVDGIRVVKIQGKRVVKGLTIVDVRLHDPRADFFERQDQ